MKKSEIVVAKEVAIDEFVRMCELFRIDLTLDEDAVESMMQPRIDVATGEEQAPGLTREEAERKLVAMFAEGHPHILEAIMANRLTVTDEGRPRYAPRTPNTPAINFKRPTGACFMAMDAAAGKQVTRCVLAATELTGSAPGAISKLEADDFNVVIRLTQLFLGLG